MHTASLSTLECSNRSSRRTVPSQLLSDRRRRSLVSLAATDSVPDSGESDTGDEDDGGIVHAVQSDGEGGGHGEERDGEADPG